MRRAVFAAVGVTAATGLAIAAGVVGADRDSLQRDRVGALSTKPVGSPAPAEEPAGNAAGAMLPGTIGATFDPAAPTTYTLDLRAGDAVRVALVGDAESFAELSTGDTFYWGISLGIGVDESLADALEIGDWSGGGRSNDDFFSDFRSDDWDYESADPSPYETVARQYPVIWVDDDVQRYGDDPPQFGCSAKDQDAAVSAAWANFVAPADGVYTVLVIGTGDYDLTAEVQAAPAEFEPGDGPFPFTGDVWGELVDAQWEFLFDVDFYPPEVSTVKAYAPAALAADCATERAGTA